MKRQYRKRGFTTEKNNYLEIILISLFISTVLGAAFGFFNSLLYEIISFGITFNVIIAAILGNKIREKSYFNNNNMGVIAVLFAIYSMFVINYVEGLYMLKDFRLALVYVSMYFRHYISLIDFVFILLSCYVAYKWATR